VESTSPVSSVDSPIMRRPLGLRLHWLLRLKVAALFNGATAHNGPRPLQKLLSCDDALCHTQIPDRLFNVSMPNSLWLTKREYLGVTVHDSHAKPSTRVSDVQSP